MSRYIFQSNRFFFQKSRNATCVIVELFTTTYIQNYTAKLEFNLLGQQSLRYVYLLCIITVIKRSIPIRHRRET
jgi:hypothetical protein